MPDEATLGKLTASEATPGLKDIQFHSRPTAFQLLKIKRDQLQRRADDLSLLIDILDERSLSEEQERALWSIFSELR